MSNLEKDLRRRSLHSDVRGLCPLERAIVVREEVASPVEDFFKVSKVPVTSFYRAVKAKKEGRQVGQNGRPGILSQDEEIMVVEMISVSYFERVPLHSPDVCAKVRSFLEAQSHLHPSPLFTYNVIKAVEVLKMRFISDNGEVNLPDDWELLCSKINYGWYFRFMKRHKETLVSRKRRVLEPERFNVSPQDCISFFRIFRGISGGILYSSIHLGKYG